MSLPQPIPSRKRPPSRRGAETFDIEADGQRYCATVGRFDDGRLAEIFISNNKSGSQADTNARDASVVASIALQYGVPVDVLRKALMRDARGAPCGPLAVALDRVSAKVSVPQEETFALEEHLNGGPDV